MIDATATARSGPAGGERVVIGGKDGSTTSDRAAGFIGRAATLATTSYTPE